MVIRPFRGYQKLTLWSWPWCLTYLLKTLNLALSFEWYVRLRTLMFHMSVCCDKLFQWVRIGLTLWPWPLYLTYSLKTLSLSISFEWYALEFWYFTWVFVVTRSFHGYQQVWPLNLTYLFDRLKENFNLGYI
jgi:hypothetical protein